MSKDFISGKIKIDFFLHFETLQKDPRTIQLAFLRKFAKTLDSIIYLLKRCATCNYALKCHKTKL